MPDRTNRNLRWVKRQLDKGGLTDILEGEILEAMSFAELEIMERTGSVKVNTVITFDSVGSHALGVYDYPAGTDRVNFIACPVTWVKPVILTESPQEFDRIQKANIQGTQPLVALVQNAKINFWPIPTNGETVTLYANRTPKADGSEAQVEGVGDPILSFHWDLTLRYMALSTLVGGDWIVRAEAEYNREAHHHTQEAGSPLLVDHSSSRLGF